MTRSTALRATLLATLALAAPAAAQDQQTPDADTVVARVGETEITLGHVLVVRRQLPAQVSQLPDDVLLNGIIDQLVDQYLLAGELEGMGELPETVRLQLENENRALAASAVIRTMLAGGLDEAAVQAAYDESYGSQEPALEYNASHILVETEEEAAAIVTELEGGADFATLAQERSTGPSGPNGGQLGWFGAGMMVPEFENAVVALKPETVSAPVQTQFGWHVIRLNETREVPPPALDEVRAELEQKVQQDMVAARIEELRAEAGAEILTEGLDPAILRDDSILPE